MDCHDPHSYKLKLPLANNALCLSCHLPPGQKGAIGIDPVQHGHHSLTNAGSACVECHMQQTTYMQRDARRDHGFTSPDPQLTKELGIPNACNRCHADKTVEWSIDWTKQWYGEKMEQRRARQRARVIARGQAVEAGNVSDLVALARSEEIVSWRATLLTLLQPWAAHAGVRALLAESLTNAHPLIRSAAIQGLRSQPGAYDLLAPLRRDPVRLVRLDAAWATLNPIEREPGSYAELVAYLNTVCDQPAGAIRQGQKALVENQPALAEAWMRKAALWDPSSVPQNLLGHVLVRNGKTAEAEAMFQKAAACDPTNAEYPYTLALFYSELNRLDEARIQLQQAVKLNPGFGRAWYNLGLAQAALNSVDEAQAALTRAEVLLPESPDAPYALATVLARAGNSPGARAAAQRALAISPAHAPAQQLLVALAAAPPDDHPAADADPTSGAARISK
jgi:tetratricopeptide (TPR) repeat protein